MNETIPVPVTTAAPTDRKYLLERIGEAAVVQVYADALPRSAAPREDADLAPRPGRDRRARHLLRPALRPQPRDARRPRSDRHAPAGIDPATLDEITRYTKLFWINTGPYNNLTARKFVLTCTAGALAAAAHAAVRNGAVFPAAGGRDARRAPRAPEADVLRSRRRSRRHQQDAARRQGHRHRQREQPLRRPHAAGSRGVRGEIPAQFATRHARRRAGRGGVPGGRPVRRADRSDRPSPRGGDSVCDRVHGRARCARSSRSTAAEKRPIARRTTSPGCRTRRRRSTRSTASSRCISTRGASKARGKRSCSTSTRRRPRRYGRSRNRRSGSKTTCRGIPSTARKAFAGSPPTPSTWSSRRETRVRSRRSASTSPTTRRFASSTAASRCRSRTSTRPTTDRRCRSSAASSAGRRRKPQRSNRWNAFAGELTTNMHEVIGHGSGKVAERLNGNPQSALREQFSAIEESRADLVALYFLPDPKLVEFGIVPAGRARRHRQDGVRKLHAQRARAAAACARRHRHRRRSHAQPPDDRALADGQHHGDRRADAATARRFT